MCTLPAGVSYVVGFSGNPNNGTNTAGACAPVFGADITFTGPGNCEIEFLGTDCNGCGTMTSEASGASAGIASGPFLAAAMGTGTVISDYCSGQSGNNCMDTAGDNRCFLSIRYRINCAI
jgi:hypothetical protein